MGGIKPYTQEEWDQLAEDIRKNPAHPKVMGRSPESILGPRPFAKTGGTGLDSPIFSRDITNVPLRKKREEGPDPMTIGAPSIGASAEYEIKKRFREHSRDYAVGGKLGEVFSFSDKAAGGVVGTAAGEVGKYADDPIQAAGSDIKAGKDMALGLVPAMAKSLVVNPIQLMLDDIGTKRFDLTDEERQQKIKETIFTAVPLLIGGRLFPSPILTRYRNVIGEAKNISNASRIIGAEFPKFGTVLKESVVQGAKAGVVIGAGQAAAEATDAEDFGSKLFKYSVATIPFGMAMDAAFAVRQYPKMISNIAQAKLMATDLLTVDNAQRLGRTFDDVLFHGTETKKPY